MESSPNKTAVANAAEAPRALARAARAASAADRSGASRRFWACATILGLSALLVHVLPPWIGWFFRKEAVPLRQPLQLLDLSKLGPRYQRHRR